MHIPRSHRATKGNLGKLIATPEAKKLNDVIVFRQEQPFRFVARILMRGCPRAARLGRGVLLAAHRTRDHLGRHGGRSHGLSGLVKAKSVFLFGFDRGHVIEEFEEKEGTRICLLNNVTCK